MRCCCRCDLLIERKNHHDLVSSPLATSCTLNDVWEHIKIKTNDGNYRARQKPLLSHEPQTTLKGNKLFGFKSFDLTCRRRIAFFLLCAPSTISVRSSWRTPCLNCHDRLSNLKVRSKASSLGSIIVCCFNINLVLLHVPIESFFRSNKFDQFNSPRSVLDVLCRLIIISGHHSKNNNLQFRNIPDYFPVFKDSKG